tara:strand:+ start:380 stop:682 length:303 start_codon:yes stop_codon:yes gene_type:complete
MVNLEDAKHIVYDSIKVSCADIDKMSGSELHWELGQRVVNLGLVVDALNNVDSFGWKYEGQQDVAELVIHRIVGELIKDTSPVKRAMILSATGFSQNAFD